jgi:hypothetical protein
MQPLQQQSSQFMPIQGMHQMNVPQQRMPPPQHLGVQQMNIPQQPMPPPQQIHPMMPPYAQQQPPPTNQQPPVQYPTQQWGQAGTPQQNPSVPGFQPSAFQQPQYPAQNGFQQQQAQQSRPNVSMFDPMAK